ncbi:serine protease grass-like isoform X2 [Musca autumnalis]|uniref:serine protease grass-like isoform X2 n=1 Tax=Musca autumnalis TaxID=221902 RepID=UPI003CF8AA7F
MDSLEYFIFLILVSIVGCQEQCLTPNETKGFCVHYTQCEFLNKWNVQYNNNLPPHLKEYIRQAQCSGPFEKEIRYCCENETQTKPQIITTTNTPWSDAYKPPSNEVTSTAGSTTTQRSIPNQLNIAEPCLTPLNISGFCVHYSQCSLRNDWIQKYGDNLPVHVQDYLNKAKCSSDHETEDRLCCELKMDIEPKIETTTIGITPWKWWNRNRITVIRSQPLVRTTKIHVPDQLNMEEERCLTPHNRNGFCVQYSQCPLLHDGNKQYNGNLPDNLKNYIEDAKCSKDHETVVRICCELEIIPTIGIMPRNARIHGLRNFTSISAEHTKENHVPDQLNIEGLNILKNQSCGLDNGYRIANGNKTDLAEFPWMALLKYVGPSGDEFRCGGTLITQRYVLTAAHCINRNYQIVAVRLGEYDISQLEDCMKKGPITRCNPPVEDVGVENIIIHPEYSKRYRINDIALIKLNQTVTFKEHIKPICLPNDLSYAQPQPDTDLIISGWGLTEHGYTSNVLLKAQIQQFPISKCNADYSRQYNEKQCLCAGDEEFGRDTCKGDSGGPLMQFAPYNGKKRFIQYGVVALGRDRCKLNDTLSGVYTNVSHHMPWITHIIVS